MVSPSSTLCGCSKVYHDFLWQYRHSVCLMHTVCVCATFLGICVPTRRQSCVFIEAVGVCVLKSIHRIK